jgi:hypothetical protein
MSNDPLAKAFLESADAWLCQQYWLDFRYIASRRGDCYALWDAALYLNPLPPKADLGLQLEPSPAFAIGQIQSMPEAPELLRLLADSVSGRFTISKGMEFALPTEAHLSFYTEMARLDRWFSPLHLQVAGISPMNVSQAELTQVDNALRLANPPFDGLADVANWLDLKVPGSSTPALNIRVNPPVDLIFDRCKLTDNNLRLTLQAHPRFDVRRMGLSLRMAPGGTGLSSRRRATDEVVW